MVCGHSLGGKVALEYLSQTASGGSVSAPCEVWVLDSQPGEVQPGMVPDVDLVLEAVKVRPRPTCPEKHALCSVYMQASAAVQ